MLLLLPVWGSSSISVIDIDFIQVSWQFYQSTDNILTVTLQAAADSIKNLEVQALPGSQEHVWVENSVDIPREFSDQLYLFDFLIYFWNPYTCSEALKLCK